MKPEDQLECYWSVEKEENPKKELFKEKYGLEVKRASH